MAKKKDKKEFHNTHVLINKTLYEKAKKQAKSQGLDMTAVIEKGLELWINAKSDG